MMSEKQFVLYEHKENYYILKNPKIHLDFIEMLGDALTPEEIVDLLNDDQDEIQQLKEKLQISEASLALLIDIILFGDVDELVKRAREATEQFDKFTKEEIEEMITGGVRK